MASQTTVTLFDGATTPVSHTFDATSVVNENGTVTATWRENLASLPIAGQCYLKNVLRPVKNSVYSGEVEVGVPVMESATTTGVSGYTAAPKVAHTLREKYVFYRHERATQALARTSRQLLVNWMNNVSTSVATPTSGVIDDLSAKMIVVS